VLQTLFHIPAEIFGIPVFGPVVDGTITRGPGLLLALWVLFSIGLMAWLIRRQGFNADTWGYLLLLVPVALVIYALLPALCDSQGLPIRGYGVMFLLGVVAGTILAAWRAWQRGLDPDLIFSLAFWLFVPGIIGARMFYVIEYWAEYQRQDLGAMVGDILNISEGGLVAYGGLIGATLGLVGFVWKRRLPVLATFDLCAPSFMLGLAFGRIGCLLNGCCFGGPCDLPWKVAFPFNSPPHVHQVQHGETFVHGVKLSQDATGPVIAAVEAGSPAEEVGLAPGQRIIEINGVLTDTIHRAHQVLLHAHHLHLGITRSDGRTTRWTIELPQHASRPVYEVRDGQIALRGLRIRDRGEDPPVIAEVHPGSPAARQGLRRGDRIVTINGRAVDTTAALRTLLDAHRTSPWVRIQRGGGDSPVLWTVADPLPRSEYVHPTQVYSAINALLLCLLLLAYDPFRRRDGEVFAILITIYPIARFLLEMIRTDESGVFGTGLSISQNVSLGLLIGATGLWCYILRQPLLQQHQNAPGGRPPDPPAEA